MLCPYCSTNDDKVIDSRSSEGGAVIRRRRECLACQRRFTTYERVEQTSRIAVVKRDGSREPFSRDKILAGIVAACGKRPVPEPEKIRIVDEVEEAIHREFDKEVEASEIGQRVMAQLRDVDQVAYIRFASEYHQFRTVEDIMEELRLLHERPPEARDQQRLFP